MEFLVLWLVAGLVCFILARGAWGLTFGCQSVTVGTILGALIAMWVPPLTLLAAMAWSVMWLIEGDTVAGPIRRLLRIEIANPCRWFFRRKSNGLGID